MKKQQPALSAIPPMKTATLPEASAIEHKPRKEPSDAALLNLRITQAERKDVHQVSLDLDMTAKDLIMLAFREFKERRGLH